jgi:hypothetical protein
MTTVLRLRTAALAMGIVVGAGCAAEGEPSLAEVRQSFVKTDNGMRSINGLRLLNGLVSINGLTTTNGMRSRNGLISINGLITVNGRRSRNGLEVDCTDGLLDETCLGKPDGLLSNESGLMSSDGGIETASYLIRCALPAGDSIRVKDYTDTLVTLPGELGLTPEWKDGECGETCQERISACLMAFTNGDGVHVDIEMSAQFTLGVGHSREFPYQEAVFYGNLFQDPPQAYYCVGEDYAVSGRGTSNLETRACEGYNEKDGTCPYVRTGVCGDANDGRSDRFSFFSADKCRFTRTGDTATSCKSGSGFAAKSWLNPITTFRKVRE